MDKVFSNLNSNSKDTHICMLTLFLAMASHPHGVVMPSFLLCGMIFFCRQQGWGYGFVAFTCLRDMGRKRMKCNRLESPPRESLPSAVVCWNIFRYFSDIFPLSPLYRSLAYLFRMEWNPRKKVKEENIARIKYPLFHKCSMRWFHVTWGGTNNAHPHIHIFIDINKDILFSAKRKWIFVEQKEKIIIWKWKMVQNKKRKNVNWSMEFICANMIAR